MSIVKDQNLAPAGRRKEINWVRDFMPALGGIEARFEQGAALRRPAGGGVPSTWRPRPPTWAMCSPKGGRGGAPVTGSNPLSTQDDVAAGLADYGRGDLRHPWSYPRRV